MTVKVVEQLGLKPIRSEYLNVNAFQSLTQKVQQLDVVEFNVPHVNNSEMCKMEAFVVPIICSPIRNQVIEAAKEKYVTLQNIDLADSNTRKVDLHVDILVGADNYWKFMTGKVIRVDHDLRALETSLGWVLNGNVNFRKETVVVIDKRNYGECFAG